MKEKCLNIEQTKMYQIYSCWLEDNFLNSLSLFLVLFFFIDFILFFPSFFIYVCFHMWTASKWDHCIVSASATDRLPRTACCSQTHFFSLPLVSRCYYRFPQSGSRKVLFDNTKLFPSKDKNSYWICYVFLLTFASSIPKDESAFPDLSLYLKISFWVFLS